MQSWNCNPRVLLFLIFLPLPRLKRKKKIRSTYAKVLGSAVNPVLREGNSDRRVAKPVKEYAQKNPHSMGTWKTASKSHVAHMSTGDFYGSEKSIIFQQAGEVNIEFIDQSGEIKLLKENLSLLEGEVIDASVMSRKELRSFLSAQLNQAIDEEVLFSLHMKATMMKVSDPIIFGHCVEAYLGEVMDKYMEMFYIRQASTQTTDCPDFIPLWKVFPKIRSRKYNPVSNKLWLTALPLPWLTPTRESPIFMSQVM